MACFGALEFGLHDGQGLPGWENRLTTLVVEAVLSIMNLVAGKLEAKSSVELRSQHTTLDMVVRSSSSDSKRWRRYHG